MSSSDRLTGPLRAIARRADPLAPYRALYRARLISQSADLARVDVVPERDAGLLPPMSNIPLRHGIPGLSVTVAAGATLLVGWENGKPTLPFAALWASPSSKGGDDAAGGGGSGGVVQAIILNGITISFGGADLLPPLDGVLTGRAVDIFTGSQHWALGNASTKVLAEK